MTWDGSAPSPHATALQPAAAATDPRCRFGFAAAALPGAAHRGRRGRRVTCPDCLTPREQRAIQAEKARVIRRLKPELPL